MRSLLAERISDVKKSHKTRSNPAFIFRATCSCPEQVDSRDRRLSRSPQSAVRAAARPDKLVRLSNRKIRAIKPGLHATALQASSSYSYTPCEHNGTPLDAVRSADQPCLPGWSRRSACSGSHRRPAHSSSTRTRSVRLSFAYLRSYVLICAICMSCPCGALP